MADFKAMLEAKRKAAEAAKVTDVVAKEPTASMEEKKLEAPQVEEPVVKPVEKPLTFQEKMALRKAQGTGATTGIPATASARIAIENGSKPSEKEDKQAEAPKVIAPVESVPSGASPAATIPAKEDTGTPKAETTATESPTETDLVTAQAYADIKNKIEQLEALEDTALEGAMKELKKALMANPNAVSLMLDTDYGKMVLALRKITKEAQVEATKEKSTGNGKGKKATKSLPLDASVLAQVFDEL